MDEIQEKIKQCTGCTNLVDDHDFLLTNHSDKNSLFNCWCLNGWFDNIEIDEDYQNVPLNCMDFQKPE